MYFLIYFYFIDIKIVKRFRKVKYFVEDYIVEKWRGWGFFIVIIFSRGLEFRIGIGFFLFLRFGRVF